MPVGFDEEVRISAMVGPEGAKRYYSRTISIQFPDSEELLIELCRKLKQLGFPLRGLPKQALRDNSARAKLLSKYRLPAMQHSNGVHNTCGVVRWLLQRGARVRPGAAQQRGKDFQKFPQRHHQDGD